MVTIMNILKAPAICLWESNTIWNNLETKGSTKKKENKLIICTNIDFFNITTK